MNNSIGTLGRVLHQIVGTIDYDMLQCVKPILWSDTYMQIEMGDIIYPEVFRMCLQSIKEQTYN
jgi:hypothetical protein